VGRGRQGLEVFVASLLAMARLITPAVHTPISCSAMCTANELEPGAKYKVSMVWPSR
jgi:hypothetical protein